MTSRDRRTFGWMLLGWLLLWAFILEFAARLRT
jgi:hypothetical protein